MQKIRIFFEKKASVRFTSHLDMQRCMMRAFSRAKIPVWYTEGFNPHPRIVFSGALSLGFTGTAEMMDIKLAEGTTADFDAVKKSLNNALPEGIRIIKVTEPIPDMSDIAYAEYSAFLPKVKESDFSSFLSKENIFVEKKSKSGIKTVDLKEYLTDYSLSSDEVNGVSGTRFNAVLPLTQSFGINPSLIISAFDKDLFADVCRTGFYTADKTRF